MQDKRRLWHARIRRRISGRFSSKSAAAKISPAAGTLAGCRSLSRDRRLDATLSPRPADSGRIIFKHVIDKAGEQSLLADHHAMIIAGRERRKDTPAQARHFLDALRGLFKWAIKANIVKTDPTIGVDNPQTKKGPGFPAWSEDDVAAYERRWPTEQRARLARRVALHRLAPWRRRQARAPHIRDGIATLRTEKSQGEVTVTLPILPVLPRTFAAGPSGELAFICGERGQTADQRILRQ